MTPMTMKSRPRDLSSNASFLDRVELQEYHTPSERDAEEKLEVITLSVRALIVTKYNLGE